MFFSVKNGIFQQNFQDAFLFSDFCVNATGVIIIIKVVTKVNNTFYYLRTCG
jgi:hypothetical protein